MMWCKHAFTKTRLPPPNGAKGCTFTSLWLAAFLILGGFVAAFAAVMGNDDKARASLIQQSSIR